MIINPILKGFNPDPSILRVGDDYYIATSTFEWFPGVQIHHSKDLTNWRLVGQALDRSTQLDMRGIPNSGGVWAPCLTHHDHKYYLLYTIVRELNSVTKDTPNYLVTAESIHGPWSEPVYLNSTGFDPSLFHAPDGRKWLVNMVWDHRPEHNPFYGIEMTEYSVSQKCLVGEPQIIFKGTELGCTEGPHLYFRNGYYYLLTAEGGTGYEHAVTLARSRSLNGPYEVHPDNPILTSWGDESLALQKTGHADLVETQNGEWYMVHLAARPLPGTNRCVLGRETAIQKMIWREDWLYLKAGGNRSQLRVESPDLVETDWEMPATRDNFEDQKLGVHFQTPRESLESSISLSERPGYLRLFGRDSLESKFNQTLVARRQQAFQVEASTLLEFEPRSFQQMAGLVCYYSTRLFHYLYLSRDEDLGPCLYVQSNNDGKISYPLGAKCLALGETKSVYLKVMIDRSELTFYYSLDGQKWLVVSEKLDASILSDDYGKEWGFTGCFIGLACQDLTGKRIKADFSYFEYLELDESREM